MHEHHGAKSEFVCTTACTECTRLRGSFRERVETWHGHGHGTWTETVYVRTLNPTRSVRILDSEEVYAKEGEVVKKKAEGHIQLYNLNHRAGEKKHEGEGGNDIGGEASVSS